MDRIRLVQWTPTTNISPNSFSMTISQNKSLAIQHLFRIGSAAGNGGFPSYDTFLTFPEPGPVNAT